MDLPFGKRAVSCSTESMGRSVSEDFHGISEFREPVCEF